MNRKASSHSLRVFLYPLIFGIAVILLIAVFGSVLMKKVEAYEERLAVEAEKQDKLEQLQNEVKDFKQRQERFLTDKDFIARVAHEQGMVFPDEFRVDFKDQNQR